MRTRDLVPKPYQRTAILSLLAIAACSEPDLPTQPDTRLPDAPASVSTAAPSLLVTHSSVTIFRGRGVLLGATLSDPANTAQATNPIVWKSSNPSVATVGSSTGQVLGMSPGTATITASTKDRKFSNSTVVTVVSRPSCVNPAPIPDDVTGGIAPIPAGFEDTPLMFRIKVVDDSDPCHRYTFVITEEPISGTLFQVSEDGIPQLNMPIRVNATVINSEGWVVFIPFPNFNGMDSFRYDVSNQNGFQYGFQSPAVFPVLAINDPPLARVWTHLGQNNFSITNVILQASDVDGVASTICISDLPRDGDLYWGQVSAPDRVVKGDCRQQPNLRYVSRVDGFFGCGPLLPRSAYPRTDTFRYYASDGASSSDVVTNTVQIDYGNLPPVFGGPGRVSTTEDTPVNFTPLATDPDGNLAAFVVNSPPANGVLWRLEPGQPPDEMTSYPTLVLAGTTLQYVPNANFNTLNTTETLTVQLTDGDPLPTCDIPIGIDISAVNDAPTIIAPDQVTAIVAPGGIGTPTTFQVGIGDDALPTDLLTVTLRGQGPAAGSVDLADATGFTFQRISPTEIKVSATLSGLNTLLGRGVTWTPNGSSAVYGELAIIADDAGSTGAGGVMVGTKIVAVDVAHEEDGLERVKAPTPSPTSAPVRRPRPTNRR